MLSFNTNKPRFILLFLFSITPVFELSANPKPETQSNSSLRTQALEENRAQQTAPSSKDNLLKVDSDLQGILKLENPYRNPRTQKTQTFLGLSFRTLRPSGKISVEGSQAFDLGQYSEQLLPQLELSLLSRRSKADSIYDWGVGLTAGYFSESRRITLSALNSSADVTFSNLLIEIGPKIYLRPSSWNSISLNLSPHAGLLQHTQNASSSYARFAKSQSFWGVSVGPQWEAFDSWSLTANYKWAQAINELPPPDKINVPQSGYSLGFTKKW